MEQTLTVEVVPLAMRTSWDPQKQLGSALHSASVVAEHSARTQVPSTERHVHWKLALQVAESVMVGQRLRLQVLEASLQMQLGSALQKSLESWPQTLGVH